MGIFLSTNISQAQATLEVGDILYYSGLIEETFEYEGDINRKKAEQTWFYEILALEDDKVSIYYFHIGPGYLMQNIWSEENYNPFSLNFPGYFMDPDSFDFFYEIWPDRYENYEDYFIVEITAEDGSFLAEMTNSSYRLPYGRNMTVQYPSPPDYGYFYDVGEYHRYDEFTYTEYGVLKYRKYETHFTGNIAERYYLYEIKLTSTAESEGASFSFVVPMITIISITILLCTFQRRRKKP